jgi:hypothetical protein
MKAGSNYLKEELVFPICQKSAYLEITMKHETRDKGPAVVKITDFFLLPVFI